MSVRLCSRAKIDSPACEMVRRGASRQSCAQGRARHLCARPAAAKAWDASTDLHEIQGAQVQPLEVCLRVCGGLKLAAL